MLFLNNKNQLNGMKKEMEAHLKEDEFGQCFARFKGRIISSVFQPIYQVRDGITECFGHEALFRLDDSAESMSPLDFMATLPIDQRYFFDRTLRALHIRNFVKKRKGDGVIFLNVDPGTYYDQNIMDAGIDLLIKRLDIIGLAPQKLVFEFIEMASVDEQILKVSIDKLKSLGARVAIDDYGVAHSSFARVKSLKPDIVKFDRSWLLRAHESEAYATDFIENVLQIRSLGIEILIEGVEFDYDLKMVESIKPDYVQGYWYGKPKKDLEICIGSK